MHYRSGDSEIQLATKTVHGTQEYAAQGYQEVYTAVSGPFAPLLASAPCEEIPKGQV